jgi:hypothetical protein
MKKQWLGTMMAVLIGVGIAILPDAAALAQGSICEGDQKIEGSSNHTYTPGGGQTVDSVCIKAGQQSFTLSCLQNDPTGCYNLVWASDCSSVTIGGGGTSRACKAISHTAATFEDGKVCEPKTEICDNKVDDDCDGLVDSADPDCDKK